jgi:hypothetical protein
MAEKNPILASVFTNPGQLGGTTDPSFEKSRDKYDERYKKYIQKYGSIPLSVYVRERGNQIPEVYYHAQVHSEGNDDILYDVVLYLYADTDAMEQEPSFKNYKVKIFSNSPAFTFRYAYVYNKLKILPEELVYKYSKMTLNTAPSKTNPNQYIGFDSSTYFVLAYLMNHHELLYRKSIAAIKKPLSQFDMTGIITPDEVVERRAPKEVSSVKKLEKTLKSIIKKPKNILFGGSKTQKVTAKGASKAVRAKHASKASRPKKPR